uniref:Ceramide synthase 1-like isoform X2 n=1 Tax=Dermatophagoides pteronyssinus TaxID=6956 RepID=A0A6P6YHM9_DERPT|nr:ceramide synthase 1-like isoform X2 [Dermatophagoides pteronyssinus]
MDKTDNMETMIIKTTNNGSNVIDSMMITNQGLNISYVDFIRDSINYFHQNLYVFLYQELFPILETREQQQQEKRKNYFSQEFNLDLAEMLRQINRFDIIFVIVLSIALTVGRYLMTRYVFMPITKICGIGPTDASKIPESSWKLLFYLFTWITSSYYIFVQHSGQLFYNPTNFWTNYSINNPVDSITYLLYMVELSFYLHSLYTTLMVDERRKDTNTLMLHHIICVGLIFISYCNNHKAGLVTLFLHDGCDILLEATKLIRYFKVQHGHTYQSAEIFVNIGFIAFLVTWITNRLYWFPIKVIYMSSIQLERLRIHVPFMTLLVIMLWIILFMNFYWFSFAIRLLYKVIAGQIDELEDSREFHQQQQQESNETNKKDECRKLSVDSGVSIRHDSRDSITPEKSLDEDENTQKNSKEPGQQYNESFVKNKIQPSYNLRNRQR